VVPDVGVENNVAYFMLGDPLGEPAFLRSILRAEGTHLLLDLLVRGRSRGFSSDVFQRYHEEVPPGVFPG
jgi:hypothetical protein